ncbi:MAG: alpha/beta hydrolase [Burkholderiales bacterium]
MPFATINRIKLHYRSQGSGPALLMFAPGGFGSVRSRWTAEGGKREWQEMDALATLSRHFTTIAYDRREAGQSGGRIEPLTWDLYVEEAKGLLDLAGERQALLLGSCMGAALALAFAVRHPAACRGLYLHWPVGGYRWMMKGHDFFRRHIEFVRANGFEAVIKRAPRGKSFWDDPEIGPWGAPTITDPEFAARFVQQDLGPYIATCERSRDALFNDTMPSGASGAELMEIRIPAFIQSGNDASHAHSAAWALKELMPQAELWNVLPPHQNGRNTLEQILAFAKRIGKTGQGA